MLYDCKRISYWIDRRLTGLAGPDYDATISFGLPLEPEDSQYGKSRINPLGMSPIMPRGFIFTSILVFRDYCLVAKRLLEQW